MPSIRTSASLLSLWCLTAPFLVAQNFVEADRSALPRVAFEAGSFWVTDLDQDGHEDIVVRSFGSFSHRHNPLTLRATGDGRWQLSEAQTFRLVIGIADVDNDGDQDLLYEGGVASNDGSGNLTFTPVWGGLHDKAAVADFTGDGLVDVALSSNYGGSSRLFVNQGGGAFANESAQRWPLTAGQLVMLPFDVDGDGDVDVFTAPYYGGAQHLLLNQGGVFSEAPAGALPAFAGRTTSAAAVDVDGDGDDDLVLGGMDVAPRLYRNQGGAAFVDASADLNQPSTESIWSIAAGDVDGDGDPDLIFGEQSGGLLLQNQGGVFTPAPAALDARDLCTTALRLHDLDGDGDLDLLQGASERTPGGGPPYMLPTDLGGAEPTLHYNDGTGAFFATTRDDLPPHDDARAFAAAADVTGDGFPDLVLGSGAGAVLVHDGYGGFASIPQGFPAAGKPLLGDLDGDGDRDCLLVASDGRFWTLENVQGATFAPWTGPQQIPVPANLYCSDAELGDVDGDGVLDLVACTAHESPGFGAPPYGAPESLWLGQGNGAFVEAPGWFSTDTTIYDIELGDLDNDGDLDVAANGGLWFQTGGAFAYVPFSGNQNWGRGSIALADLDGDGDLDAALGNKCLGYGCYPGNDEPGNEIWLNDGAGGFPSGTPLGPTSQTGTWSVAVGDTDLDGDVDIVFGNGTSNIFRDQLVENLGGGQWGYPAEPWEQELEDTRQVLLADFDRDGDLDLFALNLDRGGQLRRSKLFWNRTRQLIAPDRARVGGAYRLEMHGSTAGAGLWISLQPGFSALPPYGTLALGPLGLSPLAVLPPPSNGTTAAVSFPLPNVPALAGLTVYVQGIDVATQRLSNGIAETLVVW